MDRAVVEELVRALKVFADGQIDVSGTAIIVGYPASEALGRALAAIAAAEAELNKPIDMGR